MTAAIPAATTAMPFFRLSGDISYSIDACAPLHALLDDAQCLLGASLSTFELLAEDQDSQAYWGALYLLQQGVALLTAAQTVAPTCGPLIGAGQAVAVAEGPQ